MRWDKTFGVQGDDSAYALGHTSDGVGELSSGYEGDGGIGDIEIYVKEEN